MSEQYKKEFAPEGLNPRVENRGEEKENKPEGDKKTEVDTKYYSSVSKYFEEKERILLEGGKEPDEDTKRYADFLKEAGGKLRCIASPKQLERMKIEDISYATAQLCRSISASKEVIPEITPNEEKDFIESKRIFMDTCEKVFPNINLQLNGHMLGGELESIKRCGIEVKLINSDTINRLLEDEPKEVIEIIEASLIMTGQEMQKMAYLSFLKEDFSDSVDQEEVKNIDVEKTKKKLVILTRSFYIIEKMRDALVEKIYGRGDLTPEEISRIEELKEEVEGSSKKDFSGNENTETTPHSTGKERRETETKTETEIEREKLLSEIDKAGRLATHTVMTEELAKERGVDTGFRTIIDEKENPRSSLRSIIENPGFFDGSQYTHIMRKEDVNVIIKIEPMPRTKSVYEEVEKKGLFRAKKERVKTGERQENRPFSEISGNEEDKEATYKISYIVSGTDREEYRDPTTRRYGGIFMGHILLPEKLAKKAFEEIEKDPNFARDILAKLDPKLMASQEGFMPKGKKALVVPEQGNDRAFVKDDRNVIRGMNSDYIKDI